MNQEITIIEQQIAKSMNAISNIVITNQEDYDRAYEIGKKVSALLKHIDEKEKAITKPINDSLKKVRDIFRPFREIVTAEKTRIGAILNAYIVEEAKKKKLLEERIVARAEKGTIKEETAVRKLVEVAEAAPVTSGKTTSVLVVKIIDISKVPAEYLLLDEAKIKEDFRAGKNMDGVGFTVAYETRTRF